MNVGFENKLHRMFDNVWDTQLRTLKYPESMQFVSMDVPLVSSQSVCYYISGGTNVFRTLNSQSCRILFHEQMNALLNKLHLESARIIRQMDLE